MDADILLRQVYSHYSDYVLLGGIEFGGGGRPLFTQVEESLL